MRLNSSGLATQMNYISLTDFAKKHGRSKQRVAVLIKQGRIPVWRPVPWITLVEQNAAWPTAKKTGRPRK